MSSTANSQRSQPSATSRSRLVWARVGVFVLGCLLCEMALGAPRKVESRRRLEAQTLQLLEAGDIAGARRAYEAAQSLPGLRGREQADSIEVYALRFNDVRTAEAVAIAESLLARAVALRRHDPRSTPMEIAIEYINLVGASEWGGGFHRSLAYAESALTALSQSSDSDAAGLRLLARGSIARNQYRLDRYEEALSSVTIADREAQGDSATEARTLLEIWNTKGQVLQVLGRSLEAESTFVRAIRLARASAVDTVDYKLHSKLLNNLAGVYRDEAAYDRAEPLIAERYARDTAGGAPDTLAWATSALNRAELMRLEGRPDDAYPYYLQAFALADLSARSDPADRFDFLSQLAVALDEIGEPMKADSVFRVALMASEGSLDLEGMRVAQARADYANTCLHLNRVADAESLARAALRVRERRLGAGDALLAAPMLTLARCALASGRRQETDQRLERVVALLEGNANYPGDRFEASVLRYEMAARDGDERAADALWEKVNSDLKLLRLMRGGGISRATFLSRVMPVLDLEFERRARHGDIASAFELHEATRSRVLLEEMAFARQLRNSDTLSKTPERSLNDLLVALSSIETHLKELAQQSNVTDRERQESLVRPRAYRDSLAQELRSAREAQEMNLPEWRETLRTARHSASIPEVQAWVRKSKEPLLVFRITESGGWLFTFMPDGSRPRLDSLVFDAESARPFGLTPGGMSHDRLARALGKGTKDTLCLSLLSRNQPIDASQGASERDRMRLERQLRALFQVMIPGPVWTRICQRPRVVIVPDDVQGQLPFDALVVSRAGTKISYWLDEGPAIRIGFSATSLLALDERPPVAVGRAPRVLAVFSVAYSGGGVGETERLPNSGREVLGSVSAMRFARIDSLSGPRATEGRVREFLSQDEIVLFSTHASATGRTSDVLAGLQLAPGPGSPPRREDDGYLHMYEISTMQMKCALAVLAACETNSGRIILGESVFSLSRGFLTAGTDRVIGTLWPVADDASADLIGLLFERLTPKVNRGRFDEVTEALHRAKLRYREEHPFDGPQDWSPLVLIGKR